MRLEGGLLTARFEGCGLSVGRAIGALTSGVRYRIYGFVAKALGDRQVALQSSKGCVGLQINVSAAELGFA